MTQQLLEHELDPNPFAQFEHWFADARATQQPLPEAMTLATATNDGAVAARVVLLKSFDEHGFVFFTNYNSLKGAQLHENARAALVFWWPPLERQVRVEGAVCRVTEQESDDYWATRPRGSQLGAWASEQSRVLAGRGDLDGRFEELAATYAGDRPIPRPPHWGGYRVIPTLLEFWQGRPDRLHDRFCYRLRDAKDWVIERLSP